MTHTTANTVESAVELSRLETDHGSICYRQYGGGPLIIMLHGFPDLEGTFAAQIEDLSKTHLVVTPRLRGYPPSSTPSGLEHYALPAVAQDVRALIDHFGAEKALIVGHDWGGCVAQLFALLHPERVSGLVMLNAPVIASFDSTFASDAEQQSMSAYTLPYISYESGDDKNVEFVTRNIRDAEWRASISRYLETQPIEGMLSYYKANYPGSPYKRETPPGLLLDVPTLIVWGKEEEYFAPAVLDGLANHFSKSMRLVTIPHAGHWVHRDAPQQVTREIRSWIEVLSK
jgi:pimeloyl-ACP methyl ester carboxylesterase